jgi:lipopolysaccharide transport system permease protein
MQMLMFLTPVFWLPESLPGRTKYILWNPFAQALDLLRAPLMGSVSTSPQLDGASWAGRPPPCVVLSSLLFRKYRRRVVYWL